MGEHRLMCRHQNVQRQALRIIEMHMAGKGASEIASKTELSRSSIYRVIADVMNNQNRVRSGNE